MVYSANKSLQLTSKIIEIKIFELLKVLLSAEIGKRILSKAGNELQKECNDYFLEKKVNQIEDGKVSFFSVIIFIRLNLLF
jgi:hypothetical protein